MQQHNFRLALITGASSGIGEALARLLSSKGINLILCGRDEKKLLQLSRELPSPTSIHLCDLADREQQERLVTLLKDKTPDLIINNAGFGLYGEALSYPTEMQRQLVEVNSMAPLEITLEAARHLKKLGIKGVILNVASMTAFMPCPYLSIYAASKAFLTSFSESFDWEMAPQGIRILTACPGQVATGFRRRAAGKPQIDSAYLAMSSSKAAEEIWGQIEREQPLYCFDWRYRLFLWLIRYILPKRSIMAILQKSIAKR